MSVQNVKVMNPSMSVLLSKDHVYFTLQPHPQLLTSCMIGTPRFCMLVMIHFTSIGIWACCTSLAKFSSVIPTEDIEKLKKYKLSESGACKTPFPIKYQCWQVLARSMHSDEQSSGTTPNHRNKDEQVSSWFYFT